MLIVQHALYKYMTLSRSEQRAVANNPRTLTTRYAGGPGRAVSISIRTAVFLKGRLFEVWRFPRRESIETAA